MGTKRGSRDVPAEYREALAANIERWISSRGPGKRSERQLATMLGISQASLNEIRNKRGPLGLHVLLALRHAMRVPLDQLLGLPSWETTAASVPPIPDDLEAIRRVLREELAAIRAEKPEDKDPPNAKPLPRRSARPRGVLE